MMSCLFLAALRSVDLLALLCVVFSCVFVTFPYGVSGQFWYLIISIPDLYLLLYFVDRTTFASLEENGWGLLGYPILLSLSPSLSEVFRH